MAKKSATPESVRVVILGEGETDVPLAEIWLGSDDEDVLAIYDLVCRGVRDFIPLCRRMSDGLLLMQYFRAV